MLDSAKRAWARPRLRVTMIVSAAVLGFVAYSYWPSRPLTHEEELARNMKWADERAAREVDANERDMQRRRERVMQENQAKERLANEIIRDALARESVGGRTH